MCADQEISMFCFTHSSICWFSQEESGTKQKSETERTLNLFYSIELPWGQGLKNWHLDQIGGCSFSGVTFHGTISESVCVHKAQTTMIWKKKLHMLECFVCKSNKRIKDHTQSEKAVELYFLQCVLQCFQTVNIIFFVFLAYVFKTTIKFESYESVCRRRDVVPVMLCFVSFEWTDPPTENIHRTLTEIHSLKLCCADSHELHLIWVAYRFRHKETSVWWGGDRNCVQLEKWHFFYLLSQSLHTFRRLPCWI